VKRFLPVVLALILTLFTLAACGTPAAATLNDIPAFTGATELSAADGGVGGTLANNNQVDQQIRQSMGAGGKVEQKGFKLPAETTWDQVKKFYDEKLQAAGWSTNSLVSGIMEQANQNNPVFRISNWQRNGQNVSVVLLTSPTDPQDKKLIVSLSTQ
jgi:hypothetical protein